MPRRKVSTEHPALSRNMIIAAAMDEIDDAGLQAFNLRALAKRLDVYPSSIYWHVSSREELLADVLAHALRDSTPASDHEDWRDAIRELFTRFREAIRKHPNIAPLLASNLRINLSMDFTFAEYTLNAIKRAGFGEQALLGAYNFIMATIIGFVPQEPSQVPQDEHAQWRQKLIDRLDQVSQDEFPVLAQNMDILRDKAFFLTAQNKEDYSLDENYDQVIEFVIAGLESRVPN